MSKMYTLGDISKILKLVFMIYEAKSIAGFVIILQINRDDSCVTQMKFMYALIDLTKLILKISL